MVGGLLFTLTNFSSPTYAKEKQVELNSGVNFETDVIIGTPLTNPKDKKTDVTVEIEEIPNGIEETLNIKKIDGVASYEVPFQLPDKAYIKLAQDKDGNEINAGNIFNENHESIAIIPEILAETEDGDTIEIDATVIKGDTIKISVDSENMVSDASVSVRALTYTFSDYFSAGSWITRSGVVSLSLTPKGLVDSRKNGVLSGVIEDDSWAKVKSKFSSSSKWSNTAGLKDQYLCHYRVAAGWKSPWNIEPSRPDVSYAATVAKACNP